MTEAVGLLDHDAQVAKMLEIVTAANAARDSRELTDLTVATAIGDHTPETTTRLAKLEERVGESAVISASHGADVRIGTSRELAVRRQRHYEDVGKEFSIS